jgi:hypothetical protein
MRICASTRAKSGPQRHRKNFARYGGVWKLFKVNFASSATVRDTQSMCLLQTCCRLTAIEFLNVLF